MYLQTYNNSFLKCAFIPDPDIRGHR